MTYSEIVSAYNQHIINSMPVELFKQFSEFYIESDSFIIPLYLYNVNTTSVIKIKRVENSVNTDDSINDLSTDVDHLHTVFYTSYPSTEDVDVLSTDNFIVLYEGIYRVFASTVPNDEIVRLFSLILYFIHIGDITNGYVVIRKLSDEIKKMRAEYVNNTPVYTTNKQFEVRAWAL